MNTLLRITLMVLCIALTLGALAQGNPPPRNDGNPPPLRNNGQRPPRDGAGGGGGYTLEQAIHQLLVQNKVSAVFHGHDHLFVKQELDGIIYQEVPQPGWVGRFDSRRAVEYGYRDGVVLGSSGYLRLTVATKQATVEYVRALLPSAETSDQWNGVVAHSYTISPSSVP